ncbi:MAG: regulatory protein RecX [Betaproteobacteria bacterium]
MRLLARREYGRIELGERLVLRGALRDEVAGVLDELEQQGYLSDERYAQALVAQKAGSFGRRAIAHALKERRVATAAAADALRALDGTDELAQATALWQRRFGQAPRDERDKARQVRFLMARGYSTSVALKVLRAAGTSSRADLADADPV